MRRLLTTVLTAGLLIAAVAPAAAADEIGVSRDGATWVDNLTQPLFDEDVRWVPGDSRTVTFYVRNQADSKAQLTVTVRSTDPDDLLAADNVTLRARANGTWFTLPNGGTAEELAASLNSGGIVPIDLEATFAPGSSNASQRSAADLVLELRLTGDLDATDDAKDEPAPEDSDATSGWLPQTGAPASLVLIWSAVLISAVGIAFVAAGRRNTELEESDIHE